VVDAIAGYGLGDVEVETEEIAAILHMNILRGR
jgi:hypothetical protein